MTTILLWLALSHMPVAPATVTLAACPAYLPDRWSCYDPSAATVYLEPSEAQPRKVLFHEEGHAFDALALKAGDRRRLLPLLGFSRRTPWDWTGDVHDEAVPDPPAELFADAYATCALGVRVHFYATRPTKPAVCRLIRRVHAGRPIHAT